MAEDTQVVEDQVQTEPTTEKTLSFTVSIDEANLIVNALGEVPAKLSMGLIQKLQAQAAPQL